MQLHNRFSPRISSYLAGINVLPSFFLTGFIVLLYTSVLVVLWRYNQFDASLLWSHRLWRILRFTFIQAFLSSLLSLACGYLLARALFELNFPGKTVVLRLLSISFVLPSLVVVFAILGVFGYAGCLNQWIRSFNPNWQWSIYGWAGILIAHVFYNFPMVAQLLHQRLIQIPDTQRKLASQLGLHGWYLFKWLEWPYLRGQVWSLWLLIFTLCFSSFGIVLVLGGGPKFSTLEVEIYQSLSNLDLTQAAWYTILQLLISIILYQLTHYLSPSQGILRFNSQANQWQEQRASWYRLILALGAVFCVTFFLFPLLYIVYAMIHGFFASRFFSWNDMAIATLNSTWIGLGSAILTLLFAYAMIHGIRVLRSQGRWPTHIANSLLQLSMMSLWMPALILAVGLFLLLHQYLQSTWAILLLLFVCNAIKTLPFVIRVLQAPMEQQYQHYRRLAQTLGLSHWHYFRWIEWPCLSRYFLYAFALTFTLSLGDFTIIAFFGSFQLEALPLLLYQQMGRYQFEAAGITTGLMLLYCGFMFYFIQRWQPRTHLIKQSS